MKHTSFFCKLTAAVLFCSLCCIGMTIPADDWLDEFDSIIQASIYSDILYTEM